MSEKQERIRVATSIILGILLLVILKDAQKKLEVSSSVATINSMVVPERFELYCGEITYLCGSRSPFVYYEEGTGKRLHLRWAMFKGESEKILLQGWAPAMSWLVPGPSYLLVMQRRGGEAFINSSRPVLSCELK